jgi:hypothetical protein
VQHERRFDVRSGDAVHAIRGATQAEGRGATERAVRLAFGLPLEHIVRRAAARLAPTLEDEVGRERRWRLDRAVGDSGVRYAAIGHRNHRNDRNHRLVAGIRREARVGSAV